MNQMEFDFDHPPPFPDFSGPWMFLRRAEGEFIRFCGNLQNKTSINCLVPASWSGFYSESA